MERRILLAAVVFVLAASSVTALESGAAYGLEDSGTYLTLDPMGFLTFGPSVQVGGYFGYDNYLGGRLRLPALGLVSQVLTKSYREDNWIMPWSFAIDAVYMRVFRFNSRHAVYAGGSIGVQMSWTDNYWWEQSTLTWHVPVLANAGYELTTSPRTFIHFGGLMGIAVPISAERWDMNDKSITFDEEPDTYFVAAVEIKFGWRF